MCRNPDYFPAFRLSGRQLQGGFTMVSAIFLLVVLSALGAFMLTFSSTQHISQAQDLQGSRAYWAARSGVEWGVYQAVKASPVSCAASQNLSGPDGMTITVSCASDAWVEDAATVTFSTITATACNMPTAAGACPNSAAVGGLGYVEREIRVLVSK
jgi:MSHA biogenesis protein MshP